MAVLESIVKPLAGTADQVFERVYEPGFIQVARYISKSGGTFEDAKDIFHDALVIFYEQRISDRKVESEVKYITGIARHLWLHKFKKDIRSVSSEDHLSNFSPPKELSVDDSKLLDLLERAGKKCMDLLSAFYSEKVSLQRISKLWNFSSDHSAAVQKYKCIERVREVIKTKALAYEDFFE